MLNDKRDDFDVHMVKYSFLDDDVPRSTSQGGNGSSRSYSLSGLGSFRSYSLSVRSFRPRSFRPDFRGGSFRPNFSESFRSTLIYLDF